MNVKQRQYAGCEPWEFGGERWKSTKEGKRRKIHSHRDLDVFNLAYTLAMEVFRLTAKFPKEERYALTDQMRRSSRSVCGNVVEGFAKRRYEAVFKNSLNSPTSILQPPSPNLHSPTSNLQPPSSISHFPPRGV